MNIVFQGKSSKGNEIIIRYPTADDIPTMTDYINTLSAEQTFVTFQGEQLTLEDEAKYVNGQLEKIANHQAVQLLAFHRNTLIGISGVDMQNRIHSHLGLFGISIAKDFRGEGIGKIFMQTVLDEAEKNLPDLKIVMLSLFGNNPIAKHMYEEFGFKENGRLPNGVKYKDGFVDYVYMYKNVR